jgi:hypothetical protein
MTARLGRVGAESSAMTALAALRITFRRRVSRILVRDREALTVRRRSGASLRADAEITRRGTIYDA